MQDSNRPADSIIQPVQEQPQQQNKSNRKAFLCGFLVAALFCAAAGSFFLIRNLQNANNKEEQIKELDEKIAGISEDTTAIEDELFEIYEREGYSDAYWEKAEELDQKNDEQIGLSQEIEGIRNEMPDNTATPPVSENQDNQGSQSPSQEQPKGETPPANNDKPKEENKPVEKPSLGAVDPVIDESGYLHTSDFTGSVRKLPLPSITYREFKSNESKYQNIATYAEIKDRIGKEGAVKISGICAKDASPFFMISDPDGQMFKDAEANNGNTPIAKTAMLQNTYSLQNAIICATNNGKDKGKVTLPEGVFYFAYGHTWIDEHKAEDARSKIETHVIKPTNNLYLKGWGNSENANDRKTILKPYISKDYAPYYDCKDANGNIVKCLFKAAPDMFFYNDFKAYGYNKGRDNYLKNNRYEDFIINSEKANGADYTSAGKGFMYNVFRDTDWNRVTVLNTDGTGFGVDSPINVVINNSKAEGCGKGKTSLSGTSGASGFGIGTGYAEDEYMTITNSKAIGNRLFGFFFEHQNRFEDISKEPAHYTAMRGKTLNSSFIVSNSEARANFYNFGGLYAHDVSYSNGNTSYVGCVNLSRSVLNNQLRKAPVVNKSCTEFSVYFDKYSRRSSANGITTKMMDSGKQYYSDVNSKASAWSTDTGISYGKTAVRADGNTPLAFGYEITRTFAPNSTLTRGEVASLLWRYSGRPGDVYKKSTIPKTCFSDVSASAEYVPAIKWIVEKGITNGKQNCSSSTANDGVFAPNDKVTRAELVTFIWRLAGKPSASNTLPFTDVVSGSYYYKAVVWAVKNGITNGVTSTTFGPTQNATRNQAITMLCRYAGKCPKV